MRLRLLTAADLEKVLPMPMAIEAMKQAYAELSSGAAIVPQRLAIPVEEVSGVTLVKPALIREGLGAKLVSVFPGNRQKGKAVTPGIVVVLDRETGYPIGICEGTYLTALRTGAAVGAATDLLARPDADVGAVIGCGGQARTLIEALDAVRELQTLRLFDRNRDLAEQVADQLQSRLQTRLEPVDSAAAAIEGALVVSAITTSQEPVFDGQRLSPGCHINGMGSFTPEMQEIDTETVGRATVFVDSVSAVRTEAGDLLVAEREGVTRPDEWIELGDVVRGAKSGRSSSEEITLFKSVGVAVQDVKAATLALERASTLGVGTLVEL